MIIAVKSHKFSKELYFYDLISNFLISLCDCPIIFDEHTYIYQDAKQVLSFPGTYPKTKHLSPFQLRKQVLRGDVNKRKHIVSCCMMLANTAYESLKKYNDGSEIFQLFRYIRNTSSHLNFFQFNHKEPAHPAQ